MARALQPPFSKASVALATSLGGPGYMRRLWPLYVALGVLECSSAVYAGTIGHKPLLGYSVSHGIVTGSLCIVLGLLWRVQLQRFVAAST